MDHDRLFCLAAVVALSLVLPIYASVALGSGALDRRTASRWVWVCQAAGAFGGLLIVAAPVPPAVGVMAAGAAVSICLAGLRRRIA